MVQGSARYDAAVLQEVLQCIRIEEVQSSLEAKVQMSAGGPVLYSAVMEHIKVNVT